MVFSNDIQIRNAVPLCNDKYRLEVLNLGGSSELLGTFSSLGLEHGAGFANRLGDLLLLLPQCFADLLDTSLNLTQAC